MKRERLASEAEKGGSGAGEKRTNNYLRYGLSNITSLVESNKAKLVCIAHDVEPVELVLWLPELCK